MIGDDLTDEDIYLYVKYNGDLSNEDYQHALFFESYEGERNDQDQKHGRGMLT